MAIQNITRHATGMELFRMFRGIYADVHRQVAEYVKSRIQNPEVARECIITALSKPMIVRQRVEYYISLYTAAELTSCISIVTDGITMAELNLEISSMESFCQGLYDDYIAENITLDEVATSLLSGYVNIMEKTNFPVPPGIVNIEGK